MVSQVWLSIGGGAVQPASVATTKPIRGMLG
jgi:hypothetical protein